MKIRTIAIAMLILLSGNVLLAQKAEVNTEKSSVIWMGKKIGSKHEGLIQLKNGYVELQDDKLVAARVVMDMTSITNADLENENYNQKLVGHLKSDDFFGVEAHPTASFELTQSSEFVNGKAKLTGDITIKGKTEPISFDLVREGDELLTSIAIDRSKFDVRYGSESFFDNLGDKAIDNKFTLDIRLVVN
jgi:polyisoprenoid-binding protein YceI